MSASWPTFWEHIPETDRTALREVIAQLLKTGVVLGNSGRDLQLFRLAQDYQKEVTEYLSVLSLELSWTQPSPFFRRAPSRASAP